MDDKRIETLKVLCDILLGTRNLDGKHTRDSVHHMMQLCREYPKETCEAVGMLQSFIYELGHNSHPDEWMFESKEDCK